MKKEKAQRHVLKIIAVFFAASLWFYVLNSEPTEVERKLHITYLVPKGYSIANLATDEIVVKLRGSKAFIQNVFTTNKENLTIDLNPYFSSSGKNFKVKFYPSDINVPFGIEVQDIIPSEVSLTLDKRVQMEVPIKLQFIGEIRAERKLKELKLTDENIVVSGPIEVIKTIDRINTAPINLENMTKDEGYINVSLPTLDPRIKLEEVFNGKLKYKTYLIKNK